MKKRELEDWEKEECLALKAAVDAFNTGKSRREALTQGKIADALGINQGSVSSYLNGYNALNAKVASAIAGLISKPVESFSPRLADEIAKMAQSSFESNVEAGPPIYSSPRRINIEGTAQLGSEGYWTSLDQAAGWVETYSRDEDAYALRLKGDSMAPAIRSGWVAVCEPNHRLVPGEYVMVTTVDGQSMVKELLFETEEEVSLMSINSAYGERLTVARIDIEKIHYVGAILAPSKVLGRI
ncbi:Cro/Cl family transcriptional regulator [Pseudomonas fluorescens]|jgi:phage repressor protein C with HTH and peptisase S24 domain|uniref:LexA family transcriptional regulator n=1 Tax=Pseudomonas TaxID=286 RepID=UPI00070F1147|nr:MULTISPECIES: S24 family peptidase [Pseudomonas]OOQ44249.1 Cro/Cl family transcriptional regulator [Pseudomonas fluorescens]